MLNWRAIGPVSVMAARILPANRQALYDAYDAEIARMWQTGFADTEYENEANAPENTQSPQGRLHSRIDDHSVNQIMRDHQINMARIYAEQDRELSKAWRRS